MTVSLYRPSMISKKMLSETFWISEFLNQSEQWKLESILDWESTSSAKIDFFWIGFCAYTTYFGISRFWISFEIGRKELLTFRFYDCKFFFGVGWPMLFEAVIVVITLLWRVLHLLVEQFVICEKLSNKYEIYSLPSFDNVLFQDLECLKISWSIDFPTNSWCKIPPITLSLINQIWKNVIRQTRNRKT